MQTEAKNYTEIKRSPYAFSGYFLFVVFPVLFVFFFANAVIDQKQHYSLIEASNFLDKRAEKICDFIDPVNFLNQSFKNFEKSIDFNGLSSQKIKAVFEKFDHEKMSYVPYIFKDSELLTPPEICDNTQEQVTSVWNFVHGRSIKSQLDHKIEAQALFGGSYTRFKMQIEAGHPVEFTGRKGRGLFHYIKHDSPAHDGMFLISWKIPEASHFLEFLPEKLHDGVEISFESHGKSLANNGLKSKPASDGFLQTVTVRKSMDNQYFDFSMRFPDLDQSMNKKILKLVCLILFVGFSMLFMNRRIFAAVSAWSLRYKLMILMLYAVFLPISGLVFLGWKLVYEREAALQQTAYIACQNSINDLENEFAREKNSILEFFREIKNTPGIATQTSLLQAHFEALENQRFFNMIEIQDVENRVMLSTQDKEASERTGVVTRVFAKHSMQRFIGERLPPIQKEIPSAEEIILQEFLESPLGGWAGIFESPDELHQVAFGGHDLFWYWDVYSDPSFEPAFILIDQQARWSVNRFLEKRLLIRDTHDSAVLRRMAWSIDESSLVAGDTSVDRTEIEKFVNRVRRNRNLQNGRIFWNDQYWLAAGAPGKRLINHVLLCLYPETQIDHEIEGISRDIFRAIVFALILTVLVGRMFSATLLVPLQNLLAGIEALKQRHTEKRICIVQNDELGKLSMRFNQTMEMLEDVMNAREIQNQMMPEIPADNAGAAFDVFLRPASELGSTFFDVRKLDSGKWLVAAGETSGGGLSSSLIAAMAKAVFTTSEVGNGFSLTEVFGTLNSLLISQFNGQKTFSCFAAICNVENGEIEYLNAGHGGCLMIAEGIAPEFLQSPVDPLGIPEKQLDLKTQSIRLQVNDGIMLFSGSWVADMESESYRKKLLSLVKDFQMIEPSSLRQEICKLVIQNEKTGSEKDFSLLIFKRQPLIEKF
ncbi:MAG: PP2C family protein-serine/threonine phosphatase [Candidatus Rifleibacteriota bacterium]